MKERAYAGDGLPPAVALRLNVGPDVYRSADRIEGARPSLKNAGPSGRADDAQIALA